MISFSEFKSLAATHRVVPIVERVFSGSETPVALFEKLCGERPGTFLLESADQGVWSRYSFIGVNAKATLSKATGEQAILEMAGESNSLGDEALAALAAVLDEWKTPALADLPPLTSGIVGMLAWDVIREIEELPNRPELGYAAPEMWFCLFEDLVIVDHKTSELIFVANVFVDGSPLDLLFSDAVERLTSLHSKAGTSVRPFLADLDTSIGLNPKATHTEQTFSDTVARAIEYVKRGDVFQVVLSQRLDVELTAKPLDVYRALRALNPSPYMYLLNQSDEVGAYSIVGSSPEALVTVTDGTAVMHPIAGSRPRGANTEIDIENERSLLNDEKEKAEHLMLVDLARNDLLKVCEPTSIAVTEFMKVHRFSHIMHLVSTVEGSLTPGATTVDAFRATFPAGTLSGAPKPRALEIIDELEPESRGIFGGVVGYFDFAGNADLAIAIRTAFIRNGVARVQAGAGIVLDSVATSEYQETLSKASAPLRAVAMAEGFGRS